MRSSDFIRYLWRWGIHLLGLFGFGSAFATDLTTQPADGSVRIDNDQARVLVISTEPNAKSTLYEQKMNR